MPLNVFKGLINVFLEHSLLRLNNAVSQPVFTAELFQTSDDLCVPPLELFAQVCLFLVPKTAELDAEGRNVTQRSAVW